MATTVSDLAPGVYPSPNDAGRMAYWSGQEWDPRPLGSIAARILCNVVDIAAVIVVWIVLLIPVALFSSGNDGESGFASGFEALLVIVIIPVVAFVGYFTIFYRKLGRSLGMMLGNLHLVHLPTSSSRLPWSTSLVRAVVLGIGYVLGVTVVLWLILTMVSKSRQGPHDRAAQTVVLKGARAAGSVPVPSPAPPVADSTPERVAPASAASAGPPLASETTQAMIFISHAAEDAPIARGLSDALEAEGVRTWLANRDVAVGANYAAEIVRAVRASDYLLVLLSPAGIDSPHVRREVSIAIDAKIPVLPVSTDPTGEFMAELPVDWTYWLSLAQVLRMSDEKGTAREIARRVR